MKKKSKVLVISTFLVVSILMVGVLSTSLISAQDATVYPTIIERLASKFNLNKDDVQQVFEEVRDEHKAEMYANWAERLDDLIAEGKLTAEQKQAILDKHDEMEAKIEELKNQDLTMEERREKMRALHEEFKKWAEENGLSEIPFMFFMKPHRGMGMMFFNKQLN